MLLAKEKMKKVSSVLNIKTVFGEVICYVGNPGSFTSSSSAEA